MFEIFKLWRFANPFPLHILKIPDLIYTEFHRNTMTAMEIGNQDPSDGDVAEAMGGSAHGSRYKLSEGNLNMLQEFLRRDPDSYREEFVQQFHHFEQVGLSQGLLCPLLNTS